jgi:hypothetical protein
LIFGTLLFVIPPLLITHPAQPPSYFPVTRQLGFLPYGDNLRALHYSAYTYVSYLCSHGLTQPDTYSA